MVNKTVLKNERNTSLPVWIYFQYDMVDPISDLQ